MTKKCIQRSSQKALLEIVKTITIQFNHSSLSDKLCLIKVNTFSGINRMNLLLFAVQSFTREFIIIRFIFQPTIFFYYHYDLHNHTIIVNFTNFSNTFFLFIILKICLMPIADHHDMINIDRLLFIYFTF